MSTQSKDIDMRVVEGQPAVLASIQKRHVDNIISGKKKYEVRKAKPRLRVPFKVYIYQTLPKYGDWNDRDGHVVAEFICDEIVKDEAGENADILTRDACLTLDELKAYGENKTLYGWHISNLVVYKKPLPINAFMRDACRKVRPNCETCKFHHKFFDKCVRQIAPIRGPQSWLYVERRV